MMTKSADQKHLLARQHLLMFLHARASCHVFFSVSWCAEALCEEVMKLLVRGMLACVRSSWIQLLLQQIFWYQVYTYQADLWTEDQFIVIIVFFNNIIRDSGSREEGCRDCCEGATTGIPCIL